MFLSVIHQALTTIQPSTTVFVDVFESTLPDSPVTLLQYTFVEFHFNTLTTSSSNQNIAFIGVIFLEYEHKLHTRTFCDCNAWGCFSGTSTKIFGDLIWFDFWCFNATFNNMSAISWRPVLVVEEAGENHRPWASN